MADTPDPSASSWTFSLTTDVGEIAGMLADFAKLGGDLISVIDDPKAVAARQTQAEARQRELDAEAVTDALKGDPTKLQERSS